MIAMNIRFFQNFPLLCYKMHDTQITKDGLQYHLKKKNGQNQIRIDGVTALKNMGKDR